MFWRRRFYKSPISSVPAGEKRCLIRHKGQINVRQLAIRYDGDDTTGSNLCVITIIIDGEEIVNDTIKNLARHFCNWVVGTHLNAPFVVRDYSDSAKRYGLMFLDLGTVKENIEVWFENVDTSKSATVFSGMIYDVYEEKK